MNHHEPSFTFAPYPVDDPPPLETAAAAIAGRYSAASEAEPADSIRSCYRDRYGAEPPPDTVEAAVELGLPADAAAQFIRDITAIVKWEMDRLLHQEP
jgi:hypothetical protein